MNWKGCEMKWSWPKFKIFIFAGEIKVNYDEPQISWYSSSNSNWMSPEYR